MNMPPITKNLIIINVLFFFAQLILNMRFDLDLNDYLGLHFFLASDFHLYQLVTYMFMHGGFEHILFNMLAVWMFGRVMETMWGPKRFLLFYLICGVGAGLTQEVVQYISYSVNGLGALPLDGLVSLNGYTMRMSDYLNLWTTVGASGAIYGILLAFGVTFPNERMFIFPLPVPIKAKYFVIGYAVLELFLGFGNKGDGVAHFAHLGGMIFAWLMILYWRKNNGGGSYYGGGSSMDRMKQKVQDFFRKMFSSRPKMHASRGKMTDDMDYNARKKQRAEEIDRILEKVKRDGYGSLTDEEKRKLFDASQQ